MNNYDYLSHINGKKMLNFWNISYYTWIFNKNWNFRLIHMYLLNFLCLKFYSSNNKKYENFKIFLNKYFEFDKVIGTYVRNFKYYRSACFQIHIFKPILM